MGSEQMHMGIHQPGSHVCCRMRQINLVGGSRRKASPGCPCPSARLVPSGRTGEQGLELSLPSNAWAGLSLALGLDGDSCTRMEVRDGQQQISAVLIAWESRACLTNRFAAHLVPSIPDQSEASGVSFVGNSSSHQP